MIDDGQQLSIWRDDCTDSHVERSCVSDTAWGRSNRGRHRCCQIMMSNRSKVNEMNWR